MKYNPKFDTHRLVGYFADKINAEIFAASIEGEVESQGRYTHLVWKERDADNR